MRSSEGEVRIYNILRAHGLRFAEEYEFADLRAPNGRHLRFDFCVFNADGSIAFLIEFQGRQHYVPVKAFGGATGLRKQRYNDRAKRVYCLDHGYNLAIIPYWDEPRITFEYIMAAAGYMGEVK